MDPADVMSRDLRLPGSPAAAVAWLIVAAHRATAGAGQQRAVFVYRLVAEGSVEQAIASLQAKKQAMADALLDEGATGPLDLRAEDLAALLGPLAS